MATAELGRKVRQLDNDVQEIYTMLADISATQKRHSNRFDEIDERFNQVEDKLDKIIDFLRTTR